MPAVQTGRSWKEEEKHIQEFLDTYSLLEYFSFVLASMNERIVSSARMYSFSTFTYVSSLQRDEYEWAKVYGVSHVF